MKTPDQVLRDVGQGTISKSVAIKAMQEYADQKVKEFKAEARVAIANYKSSEGCSCCSDYNAHNEHSIVLGKMFDALYDDGSGFDFNKYRTHKR